MAAWLSKLRNWFRRKPQVVSPQWHAVTMRALTFPPRAKPRSWSTKFFEKTKWSQPRTRLVTARDGEDGQLINFNLRISLQN